MAQRCILPLKIYLTPANILHKLADVLETSVDYLISGDKSKKAKASLKNSELIQRFKEVDQLPEEEQAY